MKLNITETRPFRTLALMQLIVAAFLATGVAWFWLTISHAHHGFFLSDLATRLDPMSEYKDK